MDDPITLETLSGAALLPHLDAVAALRIAVFRDWHYPRTMAPTCLPPGHDRWARHPGRLHP